MYMISGGRSGNFSCVQWTIVPGRKHPRQVGSPEAELPAFDVHPTVWNLADDYIGLIYHTANFNAATIHYP